MIEGLKHMDGLSQMLMVIFFLIVTYRVTNHVSQPQHVLWFAGTAILVPVIFLATQSGGMGGAVGGGRPGAPAPLPAALNPYMSTFALLAFGLLAAGFLAALERKNRWTQYFLVYHTAVGIVYGYSAHYGGLQAQVLQGPAFFAALVPTAAILIFAPIAAMAVTKASFHALWVTLGTLLTLASGYVLWAVALQRLKLDPTMAPVVTFTLLFCGLLGLMLGLVLNRGWLSETAPEGAGATAGAAQAEASKGTAISV